MANIFEGLRGFEQVILVCGVALFAVALAGLIVAIARGRSYAGLVVLLVLSIAMMGFTRVKKIKAGDAEIDLDSASAQVRADPADAAARTKLSQTVANIASRRWSDPAVLTTLANAQLMLGDDQAAKENVGKALAKNPQLNKAVMLNKRIEAEAQLPSLTKQVEQNPSNTLAKERLKQSVTEIANAGNASPAALTSVAKAQAALGNQNEALKTVDKALKISPQLNQAVELKSHLQRAR
jgi:tetratricopeptide (TPR) repeat protein